jgi:hypothetical protein
MVRHWDKRKEKREKEKAKKSYEQGTGFADTRFVEAIHFLPEILSESSTSNVCSSRDTMSQLSLVSFAQFSLVFFFQRQRMS